MTAPAKIPPKPPAHVEPYVRVLGPELAVTFFLEFGGGQLYLAERPKGGSRVEQLLGADQVAALAALHLPRRVPTAKPWIARHLKFTGLSHQEIARRLHTTDVTVRKYLADGDGKPQKWTHDPRQSSLI